MTSDPCLRYQTVRALSEALTEGLTGEDMGAQAFPDASPIRWHLAHTTWFFETFILAGFVPAYQPLNPAYRMLFNSYYDAVGDRPWRPERHLLTRPVLSEVYAWRRHVDAAMLTLLQDHFTPELAPLLELGLHHEQQHQELMVTDMLAAFARNPLRPAWRTLPPVEAGQAEPLGWVSFDGGIYQIGHDGDGFAFDNEGPRHPVLLLPFRLASRPVSCGEWLNFIQDGGYQTSTLWMSDGWDACRRLGWRGPEYWVERDGVWQVMGVGGLTAIDPACAVSGLSWYEADAYARWANARLPLEEEWEVAAQGVPLTGTMLDSGLFRTGRAAAGDGLQQMFGDVWEWTGTAYRPYPGFRPAPGGVGEYNGKFMSGQMVLKGGSYATPPGHIRASYRNFFPPASRWQMTGLRLAEDAE